MELIILHGISASGKSTLAQSYIKKGYVEINRDDLRGKYFKTLYPDKEFSWKDWNWNYEDVITKNQFSEIAKNASSGINIIISNTNLNPHNNLKLENKSKSLGYTVKHIYLDVPLEVCIERDKQRKDPVGETVIRRQYKNYLQLKRILNESK